MNRQVRIVEVSPRDGLQNESALLSTEQKLQLLNLLAESGLKHIEVGAFVRPDRVPQMADTERVCAALPNLDGVTWSALVPNPRGLERALAFPALGEIALFLAASEEFNQRNIGMSIEKSLALCSEMIPVIRDSGKRVRVYLSTVVWCPYTGFISPEAVAELTAQIAALDPDEISLGDTIGKAQPAEVDSLLSSVMGVVPTNQLALHLHDTNGLALQNVKVALDAGIRTFDSSVGGVGGCPFAPGAAGNLSTNALAAMLADTGWETGLDTDRLGEAARFLLGALHPL